MEDLTKSDERVIRKKTVLAKCGLANSTMYKKIKEGTFPKPIKIGIRSVGWVESEVDDWIRRCIHESRRGI